LHKEGRILTALAEDLRATVMTIIKELGPLSKDQAVQRLIRFIDTHVSVFGRIDDSNGRIQSVYWDAAETLPDLVRQLMTKDMAALTGRLMVSLAKDSHGLAHAMAVSVVPLLPENVLSDWDDRLKQMTVGRIIQDKAGRSPH
jgi:hypothetical protein